MLQCIFFINCCMICKTSETVMQSSIINLEALLGTYDKLYLNIFLYIHVLL